LPSAGSSVGKKASHCQDTMMTIEVRRGLAHPIWTGGPHRRFQSRPRARSFGSMNCFFHTQRRGGRPMKRKKVPITRMPGACPHIGGFQKDGEQDTQGTVSPKNWQDNNGAWSTTEAQKALNVMSANNCRPYPPDHRRGMGRYSLTKSKASWSGE